MWHQWFNRNFTNLREYFLSTKKITLFNNSSPPGHPSAILESITTCSTLAAPRTCDVYVQRKAHTCIVILSKELFNKVIIFVFFEHKKYSRSFVKSWLNHWCQVDYFNDVPYYISGPGNISVALLSMQGQITLRFHQKYLNLSSENEQRSYSFGKTWGWVINDIILIFGWIIPLILAIY